MPSPRPTSLRSLTMVEGPLGPYCTVKWLTYGHAVYPFRDPTLYRRHGRHLESFHLQFKSVSTGSCLVLSPTSGLRASRGFECRQHLHQPPERDEAQWRRSKSTAGDAANRPWRSIPSRWSSPNASPSRAPCASILAGLTPPSPPSSVRPAHRDTRPPPRPRARR